MSFGHRIPATTLAGLVIQKPIVPSPEVLLRVGLGLTKACNLACSYCVTDGGLKGPDELTMEDYASLLQQAQSLGAHTIALVGEGEPLFFSGFSNLLEMINDLGMTPVLFTNGFNLNAALVKHLWNAGASIILKLNSLDPRIHDKLVGIDGEQQRAINSLDLLVQEGFADCEPTRLGIQAVIVNDNLSGMEDLWRFCRQRHIFPYIETLRRCGRAANHPELIVPQAELKKLFFHLQSIDQKEFDITWSAHPPYIANTCQQHFYSCYVRADGSVTPCSGMALVQGNVRKQSLVDILNQPLFGRLRNMSNNIHGICGSCKHGNNCYGCRANAWASSGDVFGSDPDCWVQR